MVVAEILFSFFFFGGGRLGLTAIPQIFENADVFHRFPESAARLTRLFGGKGQLPQRLVLSAGQFAVTRFEKAEFVKRNGLTRFGLSPLFHIRPNLPVELRDAHAKRGLLRHGAGDFQLLPIAGILAQFDQRGEFHRNLTLLQ